MNEVFDWCVWVLVVLAEMLGITYKEINVWIFVIVWPLLTIALVVLVFVQQRKIRQLEQKERGE